jgi:hypothetical protein
MLEADPSASANDLIQRLIASSSDLGEPGFDAVYGFGVIDPEAAVESKLTSQQNPLGSLAEWVRLYRPGSSEQEAELITPDQPGQSQPELTTVSESVSNTDLTSSNAVSWWLNPLLYWVLAPLAPLLWIFLRSKRSRNQS